MDAERHRSRRGCRLQPLKRLKRTPCRVKERHRSRRGCRLQGHRRQLRREACAAVGVVRPFRDFSPPRRPVCQASPATPPRRSPDRLRSDPGSMSDDPPASACGTRPLGLDRPVLCPNIAETIRSRLKWPPGAASQRCGGFRPPALSGPRSSAGRLDRVPASVPFSVLRLWALNRIGTGKGIPKPNDST